jgi:small basic protein
MMIPVLGLILGIIVGSIVPIHLPTTYSAYISIALLAALDSVFGGVRSMMEEKYDNTIFVTGFVSNALLAALLAYIGDRLGLPIYLAAVFAFGGRLFQNLATIRHRLLDKNFKKKKGI